MKYIRVNYSVVSCPDCAGTGKHLHYGTWVMDRSENPWVSVKIPHGCNRCTGTGKLRVYEREVPIEEPEK